MTQESLIVSYHITDRLQNNEESLNLGAVSIQSLISRKLVSVD